MSDLENVVYNIMRRPSFCAEHLEHWCTVKTLAEVEQRLRNVPRQELFDLKYTVQLYDASKMERLKQDRIEKLEGTND